MCRLIRSTDLETLKTKVWIYAKAKNIEWLANDC